MTEPQAERHRDTPEVTQIKASNQQEMARIANEHEHAMALFDEKAISRMPLALRLMFDDRLRERMHRAAEEMSRAVGFTPQHLIGKTEACLVVVTRAVTWNLDPYAVAMSTYQTPGGKVGYEGALVRAILEASGEIRGTIKDKYYGDWSKLPRPSFRMVRGDSGKMYAAPAWEYWSAVEVGLGVTISATLAETGEEMSLDFDLVDAHPRNATTWPTRPKIQLLNPAIRAFARMVRPSLLMGVHLRDDFSDAPEMRDVTPERSDPEPQPKRSALSVISELNRPPKEGTGGGGSGPNTILMARNAPPPPFAETKSNIEHVNASAEHMAADRGHAARTAPPQDATQAQEAPEPVPSGPEPVPPAENAPAGPQSAIPFGVVILGERYTSPEAAVESLILSIEQSATPSKILDDYADVMDALSDKLANKVFAAVSHRNNLLERKHADVERERQTSAKAGQEQDVPKRRGRPPGSKNRPPEPAGEARSQEPAATPTPGREDDAPEWVTEETESAPTAGTYYLTDTRGDVIDKDLTAAAFLGLLESRVAMATAAETSTWKVRNGPALNYLIQNERNDELAARAVLLLR